MTKQRIKKLTAIILFLTMMFSLNAVKCYALDETWSRGNCSGESYCDDTVAWGSTVCYEDHSFVSTQIRVRHISGDKVVFSYDEASDYYCADAYFSYTFYEILGIKSDHAIYYTDGVTTGKTASGNWQMYENEE